METHDDARHALLEHLIDHAPLFPPASLPLEEALAEDERASADEHAFVLGRLVWPASRLAELPARERALSAVLDAPLPPGASVESIEARVDEWEPEALAELDVEAFVEVPLDGSLEERLDALRGHELGAKVRCGGAASPSGAELAGFLRACRARGLPFKATAGLHHALPTNGEHGLLSLLAAVVFGDEERALGDDDPSAFSLDREVFEWRGRRAGADELARARSERLRSIGSCSFFEPVDELRALGLLR